MIKYIIIYILLVFLLGCKNGNGNSQSKIKFVKEIPKDKKGRELLFQSIRLSEKLMNLNRIEDGFDSMEIRIWFYYERKDTGQLVIIKNKNQKWNCLFYNFTNIYSDSTTSLSAINAYNVELQPKDSWQLVLDSLYSYNILTLPHFTNVPGYDNLTPNDASYVSIELASKTYYRLYGYPSPILVPHFKEGVEMERIINFISKEFSISLIEKI
jgi:hypothetical protein